MRFPLPALPALLLAAPLIAGCADNNDAGGEAGDARTIAVTSSDDACDLSAEEAPAGTLHFEVTNTGSDVTEFYLLGEDDRVIGEVENIGPDLTRELVVKADAGSYVASCKPGMSGDGIRSDFTVSDPGEAGSAGGGADSRLVKAAERKYQAYVQQQSDQLLASTAQFVRHYERGEDAAARALYPVARMHWERIETVAESFGDLDPKMDAREADLAPGQRWTGWHRIEKDLWPARATRYEPLSAKQRVAYAEDLLDNTRTLDHRIGRLHFTVDQIANGSRGLMEEVAIGKVTGEEEYWSRTDLYDFQANVEGARVGWEGVRSIAQQKDPALAKQLDARFAALQHLLDKHRSSTGFVSYDDLSAAQVKALADAVNALAEPLSGLTAVVLA